MLTNLKKYNVSVRRIVLFLTIPAVLTFSNCGVHLKNAKAENIAVTDVNGSNPTIEKMVQPYRERIDADMNKVLCVASADIDKSGKWQTPMGNLMADATLKSANEVYQQRYGQKVDFAFLNAGGVRSFITKGNVTTRTAFEIMPFDNSLITVELGPKQMQELIQYFIANKKPHPVSGIKIIQSETDSAPEVWINNVLLDPTKTYTVATSDYLYNGGDNMLFFKEGKNKRDLDYKLRNVLIDFFAKSNILHPDFSPRIQLP